MKRFLLLLVMLCACCWSFANNGGNEHKPTRTKKPLYVPLGTMVLDAGYTFEHDNRSLTHDGYRRELKETRLRAVAGKEKGNKCRKIDYLFPLALRFLGRLYVCQPVVYWDCYERPTAFFHRTFSLRIFTRATHFCVWRK